IVLPHYFSVSSRPVISSWIGCAFQAPIRCHQNGIYPSHTSTGRNTMAHGFQSLAYLRTNSIGFWLDIIRFPLVVNPFSVYRFGHAHVMGNDIQYRLEDGGNNRRASWCTYDHKESTVFFQ